MREIDATRRLALGHATTPQLGASTIGQNGLEFVDNDGNVVGIIGSGSDGGLTISNPNGPKPPKPDKPVVTADAGLLRVEWSGSFESLGDTATMKTSDLDRVEIHASMDENFVPDRVVSFGGAYATLEGGSHTLGPLGEAGTWHVRLVARSKSHKYSEPSDLVSVEMVRGSVDEALTDAWLTGSAAAITADGKNGIWRGPDEPVADPAAPFRDGDIWFEMTEDGKSIPNIWDEATEAWVGNDDYRQSEIEKVQDQLREDLDAIVVDGSGTKNFYRDTMPTDAESSEGDLWFNSADKNIPYIYQDGVWITVASSFDTPGAAEGVFTLSTPESTTKHSIENQWTDTPGFELGFNAVGITATVPEGAPAGTATIRIPLSGSFDEAGNWVVTEADRIAVNGMGVGFSGNISVNSPGATPTARVVTGVYTSEWVEVPQDVTAKEVGGTATHRFELDKQPIPIAAIYPTAYEWSVFLEISLDSVPGNGFSGGVAATYQVPEKGIADNAITTEKIKAGAITAESGIIGSINAGTITVGEMNGARIKAGTLVADTVFVESSIGSTLIKDGAILTNHIKVGSITADSGIIGSIDANVITVGKIMANQLHADAINGKTITGATIRTASSGSRVELTHNGLKQYNSLGGTVVDMTAGSIELAGDLTVSSNALVTGSLTVNAGDVADGVSMRFGRDNSGRAALNFDHGDWLEPAYIAGSKDANFREGITIFGPVKRTSLTERIGMVSIDSSYVFVGMGVKNPGFTGGSHKAAGVTFWSEKDTSPGRLVIDGGGATMEFTSVGTSDPIIRSQAIYDRALGGRSVTVSTNGTLGSSSSSLRFKQDVAVAPNMPSILDVTPKLYRYISEVKEFNDSQEYRALIGEGPLPQRFSENDSDPTPHYGAIAEEIHDLGLEHLVLYDEFGRPDALDYDKFGLALIQPVRDLRDRITELEAQLAS